MNEKYNYDRESDALHICLKKGPQEAFEEIAPRINIELDKKNNLIGIEILNVSRFFHREEPTKKAIALEKR